VPLQIDELRLGVGGNGRQTVGRVIDQSLNLDLVNRARLFILTSSHGIRDRSIVLVHKQEPAIENNLRFLGFDVHARELYPCAAGSNSRKY
jgi:hypothetical protein